jgi:ureidoglycolate hydrolase
MYYEYNMMPDPQKIFFFLRKELSMSPLSEILTVKKHDQGGYAICIDSAESWIVAINNASPASAPEEVTFFGSHSNTDETFILVTGKACIAVAPYETPEEFTMMPMDQGVCYNVRRKTWHTVLMTPGSKVAICENRNPASERYTLSAEDLQRLSSQAKTMLAE